MAHLLRKIALAIAVPMGAQLALSGCAMGGMGDRLGDQLPHALGGLPEGAPARPAKPHEYPAVHDMPATRSAKPLDDVGQLQLQRDLQNLRDRQEKAAADPDAQPAASAPGKKKAASPKTGQATGAKTNP
jgi:hypothetical protein